MIGIFENLVLVLLHFSVIALDIIFFFLLMRFLSMQWQIAPITSLDQIGSPLVESLISITQRIVGISYRNCFPVISAVLLLSRLVLIAIVKLMFAIR